MKNKVKIKSQAQLKKILDKVFSEYIRRKYSNGNGGVKCYTCGKEKHWKEIHCGHFISRGYLATRFDESNTRPQCVGCNIFGSGRNVEFAQKLNEEVGKQTVQSLFRKAQEITKNYPYEEKIEYYKQKVKELSK